MTGAPTLQRSSLAALAGVCAAALAGAPVSGSRASFTVMLPLLVLLGASLLRRVEEQRTGAKVLLLLLMTSALNLWLAQLLISLDGQRYIPPGAELHYTLSAAASSPRAAGSMLLGAGVAGALLVGRHAGALVGAALGGALGAWVGRLSLQAASGEYFAGRWESLAVDADRATLVGLLPLAGALLGWAFERGRGVRGALLSLCGALLAAVVATPPLPQLARALESPASEVPVALTEPGEPMMQAPVPLEPQALARALAAAGQRQVYPPIWPCHEPDAAQWGHVLRASAVVALPPEASTEVLRPLLPVMAMYGITRLDLLGRAPTARGVLAPLLGWPSAPVTLERPPEEARWVEITENGWRWMGVGGGPGGAESCAAWAAPGLSVGALHAALSELYGFPGEPCPSGVALTWLWVEPGAPRPSVACTAAQVDGPAP